jgi:hypothetical protein
MDQLINKHKREFAADLDSGDYELTEGGLLFPRKSVMAKGMYFHSVNGQDEQESPNLINDEGILHFLNVVMGATAKIPTWYLALYSGAISPAGSWTAANFTANATEITSNTEGYSQTVRQTFVPGVAASGAIDNLASRASFTIACTTSINVNGAGLLSVSTKGGTTGVLLSSTRFATQRTLFNADIFQLGYRVTLTG